MLHANTETDARVHACFSLFAVKSHHPLNQIEGFSFENTPHVACILNILFMLCFNCRFHCSHWRERERDTSAREMSCKPPDTHSAARVAGEHRNIARVSEKDLLTCYTTDGVCLPAPLGCLLSLMSE